MKYPLRSLQSGTDGCCGSFAAVGALLVLLIMMSCASSSAFAQQNRQTEDQALMEARSIDSLHMAVTRLADSIVQHYQHTKVEKTSSRRMSALYLLAKPVDQINMFLQADFFAAPVFYMLCALIIIWVILIVHSKRIKDQAKEMQLRVSELSMELVQARTEFEQEISQHKQLINNLNDSEQRYRSIFETTGTATIIIEDDTTISMVNSEFEKLTGYARSEIEGIASWRTFVHPDDADRMLEYSNLRRENPGSAPRSYEFRFLTRDRREREGYLYASIIPGTRRSVVSFIDITVRKQAEKQNVLLAHALRSISESVTVTDMDDTILFVNEAFLKTYGYEEGEIIGKHCSVLREKGDHTDLREATINGGWHGQMQNRRKDGSLFTIELSTSIVRDEDGNPAALIGVAKDITERLAVDEALRDSERRLKAAATELEQLNASKDKFFSIISHDLRSPLSTLRGYTDLLVHEIEAFSPETIKSVAGSMNVLAKRVHMLLENLLEWSRLQSGRMEFTPVKVDLHDLVQEVVDLMQESAIRKQVTLRNHINGNAIACIDTHMMRSVVQNLVSNAVKFSNAGARVDIEAKRNGSAVYLSVQDTGVGIGQRELEKLFRIDVQHSTPGTAEEQGSGLGLILCKELVERNGGTITAESTLGKGTTVTVAVPLWSDPS